MERERHDSEETTSKPNYNVHSIICYKKETQKSKRERNRNDRKGKKWGSLMREFEKFRSAYTESL